MIIDDKTIISSLYIGTSAVWLFRSMTLDATQEAFIRIFRSFNQLKDEKSFQGWFLRIATNLLNVYQEDIFINELRIKALAVK